MRNIIKTLFAASLLLIVGCSTISGWFGGSSGNKEYKWNVADMVGYGIDNYWMNVSPSDIAKSVSDKKLTITSIEFLGWASSGYYENPTALKEKYKALVEQTRKYKVVLFISICNDNKGSGKYGDNTKALNLYTAQIRQALQIILDEGSEGVIVQSVAETRTSAGQSFEAEANNRLAAAGFKTCWNRGSRPSSSNGCNYFAYHPASVSDAGPVGAIVVTDHSAILTQLNIGNSLYGYGDPAKVEPYASKVHQNGRAFIYYGFGHKTIDKDTIKAIGNVL